MRDIGEMKPWFRDDIARILLGLSVASRVARSTHAEEGAYRDGFVTALISVALAIGIKPETLHLFDEGEAVQRALNPSSRGSQ